MHKSQHLRLADLNNKIGLYFRIRSKGQFCKFTSYHWFGEYASHFIKHVDSNVGTFILLVVCKRNDKFKMPAANEHYVFPGLVSPQGCGSVSLSAPSIIRSITTFKIKPPPKEDEAGSSTGNNSETDCRQPLKTKLKLHIPLTWIVWRSKLGGAQVHLWLFSKKRRHTHNYKATKYFKTTWFFIV